MFTNKEYTANDLFRNFFIVMMIICIPLIWFFCNDEESKDNKNSSVVKEEQTEIIKESVGLIEEQTKVIKESVSLLEKEESEKSVSKVKLFTIDELSIYLGLSKEEINSFTEIPHLIIDDKIYYSKPSIDKWLLSMN